MSSKAPIALVRGSVKLFVNDVSVLPQVLAAVDAHECGVSGDHVEALAGASCHIMEAAGGKLPSKKLKSLRDVHFHLRHVLPGARLRQLDQLNAAYSLLRHHSPAGIKKVAAEIVTSIEGAASDATVASGVGSPG